MVPEAYYASQSEITDPAGHAALYAALPRDLRGICEAVQGLLIHIVHGNRYGLTLPAERMKQVYLCSASEMLEAIMADDPRPLLEARPPQERLIGTCRHYAVLLCSMLRHQGVAARVRNGFARYLRPGECTDHWVCEYLSKEEARWVRVDAQMDAVHREAVKLDFDYLDVPRAKYLYAGDAWRQCRAGRLDPSCCGALGLWGIDYVKANLLRDFASLNKREMLPWDGAALTERPVEDLSTDEIALLDRVADLTAPDLRFREVRDLYAAHPDLHAKQLPNLREIPLKLH